MTDLFWPGDERAGDLMAESTLLAAMVRVENAWLAALVALGVASADAKDDLDGLVHNDDVPAIARNAENGGNPVIAVLDLLRDRLAVRNPDAARWIHRGLTSQDVLDTALALCLNDVTGRLQDELATQACVLARLADEHRSTLMVGRTLTQHAVPISFGLKAAAWLQGVLDASDTLAAASELPVQIGGAAGNLAASSTLATTPNGAIELVHHCADALGLAARSPWHASRSPITRFGDALVTCTDAWGRIANDVLVGSRPEVGELAETGGGDGRGGSSTMPQKHNPVLAVLIRRAALAASPLGSTLHTAAASTVDERPDGAWHVEWATLRTLARRTVVAAAQTSELLAGLRVDTARMAATLAAASPGIDAEQQSVATLTGTTATGAYLGATDRIIGDALARARTHLEAKP